MTDIIFVKALRADSALMATLAAGDVYNTSIALPDEDVDNAPLPYAIVTFNSLNEDAESKDDQWAGVYDTVQIGVEIAAETRAELATIAQGVRDAVVNFFESAQEGDEDFELVPLSIQLSAGAVQYDSMKPCYWQTLTYNCDTRA